MQMKLVMHNFLPKVITAAITLLMVGWTLLIAPGCTPKISFYSNGYPLAKEASYASSADGKLQIKWVMARWYPKKIEIRDVSEFIDYPQYLAVDDLNTLPGDTRAVVVNVQIINPQLLRYRLLKVVELGGTTQEEAFSDWFNLSDNNLVIAGPLVFDKAVTISLSILSGETGWIDSPLISTGDMQYVICDSQPQMPRPEGKEAL